MVRGRDLQEEAALVPPELKAPRLRNDRWMLLSAIFAPWVAVPSIGTEHWLGILLYVLVLLMPVIGGTFFAWEFYQERTLVVLGDGIAEIRRNSAKFVHYDDIEGLTFKAHSSGVYVTELVVNGKTKRWSVDKPWAEAANAAYYGRKNRSPVPL